MHILIKILLLIFAFQFSLGAVDGTGTQYGGIIAEIQSDKTHPSPFSSPSHQPTLYAIHHQAENSAKTGNQVPQAQLTTEEDNLFDSSPPEAVMVRQLAIYLDASKLIEPGLSTIKLIFPFHFFL